MSEKRFQLDVVTPNRIVVQEGVEMVIAPGSEGEFGVLAGHCPFITTLKIGPLMYRQGGEPHCMTVMGGFAEVTPTKMVILAELAERAEELDLERARAAQHRAEEQLAKAVTEAERVEAHKRLAKSLIRQQVASRLQPHP
jgi:F-type H+-transporting ATPase subunit epsilon